MNKWYLRWLSPLLNERGEVGGEGTAGEGENADPEKDTGDPDAGASSGGEATPKKDESFFDPSQLAPELKKQWSSMHRAYTKKLESFKQAQEKAGAYDRFYSDENFRLQTLEQAAKQLGYTFAKAQPGSQNGQPAASTGESAPRELVERVKARLDPSLQWMAESLANAQWEGMRAVMGPKEQQEAQEKAAERTAQYEELANELSEKVPGWEEHEDEMLELLDFIKSDRMSHKRFGSKLALLHGMITGNASAISEATRRMAGAARNRTVTGSTTRSSTPNYEDRIRKAKTNQEAFKIAAQEAEAFLEQQGIPIP